MTSTDGQPEDREDLAGASARGSAVTLLSQAYLVVLRMVSIIVLARLVLPEVFGLVAVVSAIAVFATSLVFLGLPMATVQASTVSQRSQSSLFMINTALGALIGLLLFLAGPIMANLYGSPEMVPLCHWIALVPLLSGIGAQFQARLSRSLRFTAIAHADVAGQTIGAAGAIALASMGYGLAAVTIQLVAASAVQVLWMIVSARWLPTLPGAWRSEVAPIVRVALGLFGMNVLRLGSANIVVPVLGLTASADAVGQYDRAQRLTLTPINLTVEQLQRIVVPVLARLRDDPARMLRYFQRFQLINGYLTSALFLLVAALGGSIIQLLLGADWALAGTIVQILAIGAVFRSAGQSMQWLFISTGETGKGLKFNVWAQPLVVAVSLAGLPWGAIGVAAAGTIAWTIYWPLAAIAAARATHFSAREVMTVTARGVVVFAAPASAVASMAYIFPFSPLATVAIGVALFLVASAVLYILLPVVRHDLKLVTTSVSMAVRRRG